MMEDLVRQLLPKNATALERAALETLYERIDELPVLIEAIWSPAICPVELLPFLAWAVSVDVWDDDWPISKKRAVVEASPSVHRKKGTVWALETALKALAIEPRIVEWWQTVPEGRRGTFQIDAFVDDPRDFNTDISTLVNANKPKSRSFTMRIGLSQIAQLHLAQASKLGVRLSGFALSRHIPRDVSAPIRIASSTSSAIRFTGTAFAVRAGL